MKNEILAIVVTFNRKHILKDAIIALLNQTNRELDILIVDNASTDGTKEYISGELRNDTVFYENTGENLGGAGGFSYGVKSGIKHGYKYLWLMDDDTIPEPDCLENLLKAKDVLNEKFGFLCSYVEWIDGMPCHMNMPALAKNWGNYANLLDQGLLSVKTASFVSFFVKSEVVKEVGLPIKEFFIWGDDMEFSRRITKKYPSFFVKGSKVIHKMKSNKSTDIHEETGERLDRYGLLYRNRFYYGKKNGVKEFLFYIDYVMESIWRIIAKAPDRRGKRIWLLIKGFVKGIFFNPNIEFPEK